MNKIRKFEMFAGYGGASFALKKAGITFETVGYSEIDKFAIQCYEQNHGDIKNFGDCTKINPEELPDFDLLTGGFPCQAFSVAGKGLGEQDTRGTLFHDIIRIAEVKKPKYMLLENVKGLTNKRHKATFEKILSELDRIGYVVDWKVLNSKEHGIPQNRERVYFVCFRKDLDCSFVWPEKEELQLFLKDILEPEVDEKYYLSNKQTEKLLFCENYVQWDLSGKNNKSQDQRAYYQDNFHGTIPSNGDGSKCKIIQVNKPIHSSQRVYSPEGIACTISAGNRGGGKSPCKILIKNATSKGYLEATEGDGVNLEQPNSKTRRGRVQEQLSPTLQCNDARGVVVDDTQGYDGVRTYESVSPTIRAARSGLKVVEGLTIRKLTPTECFRLMGFLNDEIKLEGLSNTQRYKLAGNGWDINLVSKLFNKIMDNIKE